MTPALRLLPLPCVLASGAWMTAQTPPARAPLASSTAAGAFDVKVEPAKASDFADPALARMLLHKTYHGDLEGSGEGQMLSAGAPASGNAGYVALESVTGSLAGRKGGFALLHRGTLTGGAMDLSVDVVPGSGTGDLKGLAGRMSIEIKDGKHGYVFTYTLPPKP